MIKSNHIERRQKVAVLNYPLMNPDLKVEDYTVYLKLDEITKQTLPIPLYLHIPFCQNICKFCVYNRIRFQKDLKNQYVNALIKEIQSYGKTTYVQASKIGAIFFGGGTPTCLSIDDFERILQACREYLSVIPDVEITVECNSVNADEKKLLHLKKLGVKRISSGVQTLNQRVRREMGLQTSPEQVMEWLAMVKSIDFPVISIDLMYGLPNQTLEDWVQELNEALELPVDHFSLYELCLLAESALYRKVKNDRSIHMPEANELYLMYQKGNEILKQHGFLHHIVPEYNRANLQSVFWELNYKGYGDNLSLGASSYGFVNGVTYQNITEIDHYIQRINGGGLPIEMVSEKAGKVQLMERAVVLGLRRRYLEKDIFFEQFGVSVKDSFGNILEQLIEDGLLYEDKDCYRLTEAGEYLQGDVSIRFMQSTFSNVTLLKKQLALGKHVIPESLQ